MSRTVRTKVYKFDELSEKAKEKAIEYWRNSGNVDYEYILEEASQTLNAFCKLFNINIRGFDYCEMYRNNWTHHIDLQILELSGLRLQKYIWNHYKTDLYKGKYYGKLVDTFPNGEKIPVSDKHPVGKRHVLRYSNCVLSNDCVLTGTAYDMDILYPIYCFLNRPGKEDFQELLNSCRYSFAKTVCSEIDYRHTDEAIAEDLTANEQEFTQDGKIFNR